MVNYLVFRWPKPLVFMVWGGLMVFIEGVAICYRPKNEGMSMKREALLKGNGSFESSINF